MRSGGSIQIKAKLFCGHLSSLLSQLIPLAFVQDQFENQLSLESFFLVQRNLVPNICFTAIKIIIISLNDDAKILTETDTETFFPIPNFPKPRLLL